MTCISGDTRAQAVMNTAAKTVDRTFFMASLLFARLQNCEGIAAYLNKAVTRCEIEGLEINGMPYITADARTRLEKGGKPETAGELNYAITRLIDDYLIRKGGIRYAHLNEVVGALECAKLELYRRVAAPYEDQKLSETGDVYRSFK
jgi:hypothetical protein